MTETALHHETWVRLAFFFAFFAAMALGARFARRILTTGKTRRWLRNAMLLHSDYRDDDVVASQTIEDSQGTQPQLAFFFVFSSANPDRLSIERDSVRMLSRRFSGFPES
jgi:hypothetical protein